jgi:hypothetical protein
VNTKFETSFSSEFINRSVSYIFNMNVILVMFIQHISHRILKALLGEKIIWKGHTNKNTFHNFYFVYPFSKIIFSSRVSTSRISIENSRREMAFFWFLDLSRNETEFSTFEKRFFFQINGQFCDFY